MFKCLCCRGRQRRAEVGGGRSNKFNLENVQAAAEAQAGDPSASERYQRKKLDDDHQADRFDGPPPIQRPAETGGGAGVRGSAGKGHKLTTTAPVQKQVAPPPPAPLPVVAVNQQVNLRDADEEHGEEPVVSIVEEVLPVRIGQQYTFKQSKPSAPPQPPSAPKSSGGSSSSEEGKEEEEQRPPPPLQTSQRRPEDHLHGSTVFQSDENETTIVDSDYSDYEDDEEKLRPAAESGHAARATATLSVILPRTRPSRDEDDEEHQLKAAAERLSTFLLAEEDDDDVDGPAASFGWQTLPNSLRARGGHLTHHQPPLETLVEEEPIALHAPPPIEIQADNGEVEEDLVPPPPQQVVTEQQQLSIDDDPFMARESLLALDQALAVFELASSYDDPAAHSSSHSHAAVSGYDEPLVEEELIEPTPRN